MVSLGTGRDTKSRTKTTELKQFEEENAAIKTSSGADVLLGQLAWQKHSATT